MPGTLIFDTLAYSKRLTSAGFTQQQAEIQANTFKEIIDAKIAPKRYLKELEMKLTIKLGGMMAASIAIVAALMKLL